MSSIDAVSSAAASWTVSSSKKTSSTTDVFSKMLSNLQAGAPATGYGDNSSSSSEDTVTLTQVLSDGSVLITVMKDGEIVSQTKTRASQSQEEPTVLEATVTKGTTHHSQGANSVSVSDLQNATQASLQQSFDKFNDTSTSITAGSLFSSQV